MEALHDVVRSGKARYIGASSMFSWQFAKAQHVADLNHWTRFVSMQPHYNLIYREEEREMIPLCQDQGVGVIPWSPLARGVLAGNRTQGRRAQDHPLGHRRLHRLSLQPAHRLRCRRAGGRGGGGAGGASGPGGPGLAAPAARGDRTDHRRHQAGASGRRPGRRALSSALRSDEESPARPRRALSVPRSGARVTSDGAAVPDLRGRLPLRHHVPLRLPDLPVDPRGARPDRASTCGGGSSASRRSTGSKGRSIPGNASGPTDGR